MIYIAGRSAPWFAAVKWVEGCDLEIEFHCITSDLMELPPLKRTRLIYN